MAVTWPAGVQSSGVPCGIKDPGEPDLGIVTLEGPGAWAGTFTRSGAAAAPVEWSRGLLGRPLRAVVVNSGNANACTGAAGGAAVEQTARAAAAAMGCAPEEIAIASTGPIGVRLPVEKIVSGIPAAAGSLKSDARAFARAILTTDTVTKTARHGGDGFEVVGVAKGAAMLAPNMATMLAFIATDAVVEPAPLQEALTGAVRTSFDRISVDACQSTNDSVFLLSSGRVRGISRTQLAGGIAAVCSSLAEQMVRDAEGGSRFVRIRVTGAPDDDAGVALGRGVAASALWRAAVHGGDPNWGRVVAALGDVDPSLDLSRVGLAIGSETVFRNGEPAGSMSVAANEMENGEIVVHCSVGDGASEVEVLTTDLSPDYVTLNAGGMS